MKHQPREPRKLLRCYRCGWIFLSAVVTDGKPGPKACPECHNTLWRVKKKLKTDKKEEKQNDDTE